MYMYMYHVRGARPWVSPPLCRHGGGSSASARSVQRSGMQLALLAVLADVRLLTDSQRLACHTTKGVLNLVLVALARGCKGQTH